MIGEPGITSQDLDLFLCQEAVSAVYVCLPLDLATSSLTWLRGRNIGVTPESCIPRTQATGKELHDVDPQNQYRNASEQRDI